MSQAGSRPAAISTGSLGFAAARPLHEKFLALPFQHIREGADKVTPEQAKANIGGLRTEIRACSAYP